MEKKEAMKILKDFHDKSALFSVRTALDTIIPELRESEDEKVRKDVKRAISVALDYSYFDKETANNCLAWLEKQGKQKSYGQRKECLDCQFNYAGECKGSCQMKRDEQKPVDKSEPKFKVGDWIIHQGTENIYQVVSRIDNQYQLRYGDNYTVQKYSDVDKNARLWDITKDAKDGDVLSFKNDEIEWILIYKELVPSLQEVPHDLLRYYAILDDGYLNYNGVSAMITDDYEYYLKPATKEQRDQLEKAMADARYTFDFEKKKLRKIEQKPTDEEMKELLRTEYEKGRADAIAEMKLSWSEEDEKMLEGIVNIVKDVRCQSLLSEIEIYDDYIDWLKSLKDRYTWRPSNEQIDTLEHFIRSIGESGYASPYDNNTKLLYSLLEQLKKLKA